MLLALVLGIYLAVLGVSAWGAAMSFLVPRSLWARHRPWVFLAVSLELIYMLQAPACVYLPRAPGKRAVRRYLVGTDSLNRLYWLEAAAPMAFVYGPRWWFGSGRPLDIGGPDWVAPLRYAVWRRERWSLVRDDGQRWRVPDGQGDPGAMTVTRDGTLLDMGSYFAGLQALPLGLPTWKCVEPCGLEHFGFEIGLVANADGSIWEVYEPGNVGEIYDHRKHGERHLRVRVRRSGSMPQVFDLMLPQEPDVAASTEPSGAQASGPSSILLFLSHSRRFEDPTVQVRRIDIDTHEVSSVLSLPYSDQPPPYSDQPPPYVARPPAVFAASPDEAFYTTGQAIWDAAGRRLRGIEPPFTSVTWVGHRLAGVRPFPFFGSHYLRRSDYHSVFMRMAVRDALASGQQDELRRLAWVLGGIDESGQEDVIVQLAVDGDHE